MSLLNTENLCLSFGAFDLFKGISVSVANDSKIGLLGPNGIGKTSLLLIMAGINQPTSGKVYFARGRRLGYLRQEAVDAFADRDNTVYDEMLTVFSDLLNQQAHLNDLEKQMSEPGADLDLLLEQYGKLQLAFEHAGGYEFDQQIRQTLEGLGLGKDYWNMPLSHLSGGQKTRALLSRLLLEKPDLLILDEPTNHLDMDAVEWLERILRDWQGAVLVVSHDRFFLDNTVNVIWEMDRQGIEVYAGNYSAYLQQRQERWDYLERVFEEEKSRLTKEVDFVQRNFVRASTHARALGLLKRVSRDIAIVENYGVMALRSGKQWSEMDLHVYRPLDVIEAIRKVNAMQLPSNRPLKIRPRLAADTVSGTLVVRANRLVVGYPDKRLFGVANLELRRGECAALIGPNGSGKTSFIKTMLGQISPLEGEVQLGSSLKLGYFAQAHDMLRPELTVIDELLRHKEMQPESARHHLAQYLFRGEDVFKPVSALSGGERARLALAILALEGSNFLVLDEPTNHLDIPAQEALQDVLDNFPGTILLVSHDRYLIDRLATQIWDLRDGKLMVFKGNYREYVLRQAQVSGVITTRQVLAPVHRIVQGNDKETRKRAQAVSALEDRIRDQEGAVQKLYAALQKASDRGAFEDVHKMGWQITQAQAALDQMMSEWEKLAG